MTPDVVISSTTIATSSLFATKTTSSSSTTTLVASTATTSASAASTVSRITSIFHRMTPHVLSRIHSTTTLVGVVIIRGISSYHLCRHTTSLLRYSIHVWVSTAHELLLPCHLRRIPRHVRLPCHLRWVSSHIRLTWTGSRRRHIVCDRHRLSRLLLLLLWRSLSWCLLLRRSLSWLLLLWLLLRCLLLLLLLRWLGGLRLFLCFLW
mmetsp:Transcript_27794/g.39090  ORF Transcript_27794/g.39090 Transcript_27794/m.39090 type:complete len:207 (+) Transcript_27794:187-807(+)